MKADMLHGCPDRKLQEPTVYLLEPGQAVGAAQRLVAALRLQAQRFVAGRAAVLAHRQLVEGAETVEARVAAELVDHTLQNDLVFALQGQKPEPDLGFVSRPPGGRFGSVCAFLTMQYLLQALHWA